MIVMISVIMMILMTMVVTPYQEYYIIFIMISPRHPPRNQSDHHLDQLDRKADSDESADLLLFCDLFLKTIFTAPQIENSD